MRVEHFLRIVPSERAMLQKLPPSIGEALRGRRAGLAHIVFYQISNPFDLAPIKVTSTAFNADGPIPARYTADGLGISPPLTWNRSCEDAGSFAVIVEDADAPTPRPLVHAIIVNLEAQDTSLPEGALNSPHHQGLGFDTGRNSYLMQAWLPPDPPPGHGTHRYVFQVFALRGAADFKGAPGRHELMEAITSRAVAGGHLTGTYDRAQRVPHDSRKEEENEGLQKGMPAGEAGIAEA
jgi:Raf kinase inhibitor-like YbhB/YbcL family protein